MPQFAPSVQKMAVAPITVAPAGLDCEAELFLGPNDATPVVSSGLRPFVSSGAAQQVSFPVTMPANPGTYHVYVDVHAGGSLILAYQGTEDVVITAPYPVEFVSAVVHDFNYQATYNSAWQQWFYQAVVKMDYQFTALTDPLLYGQIKGSIRLRNAAGTELTGSYVTTGGMLGPDANGYYFPSSGYGTWPYTAFVFGGEILAEMVGELTWEVELVAYKTLDDPYGQRTFTGTCQGLGRE